MICISCPSLTTIRQLAPLLSYVFFVGLVYNAALGQVLIYAWSLLPIYFMTDSAVSYSVDSNCVVSPAKLAAIMAKVHMLSIFRWRTKLWNEIFHDMRLKMRMMGILTLPTGGLLEWNLLIPYGGRLSFLLVFEGLTTLIFDGGMSILQRLFLDDTL